MLSCENLEKKYMTVTAVKDISVTIEPGKIYALLGPNGSGKTTFMKMVAGLTAPTSGCITMDNEPLNVKHKSVIAYMPTESYFYSYMNCQDVAKYYSDFFEDFSMERFQTLMEKLQLSHKDKVSKMSSGMLAKLKLAVTLARDAKIVMLDEPLNGIDLIARENIINTIICNASEDRAIIISSHLVDELEKIIDYAIFIKDGSLVRKGSAEELRENSGKSIVDLYKEIYA
ncbi:MAG: ABC transporter ATP-binding protein [Lachnospiraceae bacterium]